MRGRLVWIVVGLGLTVVLAAGGAAAARATGAFSDDEDAQLSGPAADLAANAAARAVRGVKVTGVERDDDNAYEVEVMRADGTTVDVDVNGAFEVVAVDESEDADANEDETEDADEADEPDDDATEDAADDDGPDDDADEPADD